MWLKEKNWKPYELQIMCHPVIAWFTLQHCLKFILCLVPWRFFSSREITHAVMLRAAWEHWPSFVNGRRRIVKSKMKRENFLGPSFKLLSGRSILYRWHVEVREWKIHYLRTSHIHIHLKKFSWTSICRYAHPDLKTTALGDLLGLLASYNSVITCRLLCYKL